MIQDYCSNIHTFKGSIKPQIQFRWGCDGTKPKWEKFLYWCKHFYYMRSSRVEICLLCIASPIYLHTCIESNYNLTLYCLLRVVASQYSMGRYFKRVGRYIVIFHNLPLVFFCQQQVRYRYTYYDYAGYKFLLKWFSKTEKKLLKIYRCGR